MSGLPGAGSPGVGVPEVGAPGAVLRTVAVAERCRYTPPLGGVVFPEIELEDEETPYSRLCTLAFEGARRRYQPLRPEVLRRLDYELSTIHQLGFAPYFLPVHEIASFAEPTAEGLAEAMYELAADPEQRALLSKRVADWSARRSWAAAGAAYASLLTGDPDHVEVI